MNTHKNMLNGKLMKLMSIIMAVVLVGIANVELARAQTYSDPVQLQMATAETVDYSFSVPVETVVANPCTGGSELVSGNTELSIQTAESDSFFVLNINSSSLGTSEDVMLSSSSSLYLDSTQKVASDYAAETISTATFETKPGYVLQTLTIGQYVGGEEDSGMLGSPKIYPAYELQTDSTMATAYPVEETDVVVSEPYIINTVYEITYTDGVPQTAVLTSIDTKCAN